MSKGIPEPVRAAYLDALGIEVWRPRDAADEAGEAVVETPARASPAPTATGPAAAAPDAVPADWESLQRAVATCTLCPLHETRTQAVFGVGNRAADLLVIGEAPGAEEDRRGEPFVGRAGQLLDEMLRAVGLDRQTVFIANILKCRPPGNRDPRPEEAASCRAYLEQQIDTIRPRVILAVGRIAAQQLLGSDAPLGRLRGQQHRLEKQGIPIVVTYHPAYLLRTPAQKRKVWLDLCAARRLLRGAAA